MSDADQQLLAAASGDDRAFAAFYRRHLPALTAWFAARTDGREQALDLTAETFAAVVAGLGRFDPQRGPAQAWLWAIARRKLVDSYRRGRVEREARDALGWGPLAYDKDDLDRVGELDALGQADLPRLLAELPAAEREAVQRRVIGEEDYERIAGELACSELVVRQRVSRGLRRLRARLSGETR